MRNLIFSCVVALAPLAAHAQAVPRILERYTYTYVTPGPVTDFTGASYVYNNTVNFDQIAGVYAGSVTIQPGAQNIVFYGQGATTVTPSSAPDFTAVVPISAVSPGGAGQGLGFDYIGGANGFLNPTVINGRHALAFSGGGFGFVDIGGRFVSSVVIGGDWSGAAAHTAATFGTGYSVLQNFAFDGTSTRFVVETTDYQNVNPSIAFALLAPAPEPGVWAMMIVGFGTVGSSLRSRQRHRATTGKA